MSECYTFERRRIFRRRSSWPSRTSYVVVIVLGAIFGYLLPGLVSGVGSNSASFGEPAFGSIGATSPTDIVANSCEHPRPAEGDLVDCTGVRIRLASVEALAASSRCNLGGFCMPVSADLDAEARPLAWTKGLADLSLDERHAAPAAGDR
jgi:hypothetical protein